MAESVSILVVDDEPALRRLLQLYLGHPRIGYTVDVCADAACAVQQVTAEPDRYRLAIIDVTLPDMRGDELSIRLLKLSPALRILLCSGMPFELRTLPAELRSSFDTSSSRLSRRC